MWETWVRSLGWEDPLEKEKATHSSVLAWRIPWIQPMGSQSRTRLSDFYFLSLSKTELIFLRFTKHPLSVSGFHLGPHIMIVWNVSLGISRLC